MRRLAAVPVLGLAFAVACETSTTSPNRIGPDAAVPSFQQGPSDQPCVGVLPPGTYQNVFVPAGATCTLNNSVLTGNLRALEGSRLNASFNTIAGNVEGLRAARLDLRFGTVGGNVEIKEGAGDPTTSLDYLVFMVTLDEGNVHAIKNSGGHVFVDLNLLRRGNINVEDNSNLVRLDVFNNRLDAGNVHAVKNSGDSLFVQSNLLRRGNIKVEDNSNVTRLQVFSNTLNDPTLGTGGNLQVFKNTGTSNKFVQANTVRQNVQCKENTPPFFGTPNTTIEGKLEGQCGVPPTPS